MTNSIARREFVRSAAFLLGSAMAGRKARALERTERVTLKTLDGGTAAIDSAGITELKTGLKGELLIDGVAANAPEYEDARKIWNAAIDRHPAVIIRCVDASDIACTLRFAKRHNALLSVRGGGHNHVGFAVCDGGVMIDLARLGTVEVDADQRVATAGSGTTFGTYDLATYQKGLASTGPIISMVGIGGYTLGGGIGWLHRKLGLGCDNLISAEMVTAEGDIITLSETVNSDLFWAIRGGGGNFGVVSKFKFRLAPLKDVLAGLVFHPLEDLPKIATFVREINASAPDELGLWLTMRKAPASPALPPEMYGRPVATIALCYVGADEAAEKVLKPVRQFGRPLIDLVKARPYPDWQKALDPAWENGFHNQWMGHYLPELTDGAAQTLVEYVAKVTSPFTDVKLAMLGGAMARVGEDATAFGHRDAKYAFVIQTRWNNASESAQHLAWTQEFFDAMKAHSTGSVYVNFLADEGEQRVADAYNAAAFQRLRKIKAKYDPNNLLRMNQNIRPA